MKYRPTDGELLAAIAELLEVEVLPAVPPALQHKVRVAANLIRILERQEHLEADALTRERAALSTLLGAAPDQDLAELRAELDRRLAQPAQPGQPAEPAELDPRSVWDVLVAITALDLATAKPGYDAWREG